MWTWLLVPPSQLPFSLVASTSVASVSGCQYFSCQCLWLPVPQLLVSLAASISCQFLWLPVPQLPVSRLLGTSVASASASVAGTSASVASVSAASTEIAGASTSVAGICWYLGWCPRSVPWLPRISPSQLLRTVVRRLSRIPMSHQQRCPVSRPSSPQTTTGQVICNSKM